MHQQLLRFYPRFRQILKQAIEWIGRHPSVIIILPSIWLFIHYKPFWKDVDVVAQLITAPGSLNILHFPPIYCFLARLPFWLADTLRQGTASPIFAEQHPSLLAVWVLIFFQHIGLWLALRYLLFSIDWSDVPRAELPQSKHVCPTRTISRNFLSRRVRAIQCRRFRQAGRLV